MESKIGEVIMSMDTGNVTITVTDSFTGKKTQRFLVLSEFNELMNPTDDCYQTSMNIAINQISTSTQKPRQLLGDI